MCPSLPNTFVRLGAAPTVTRYDVTVPYTRRIPFLYDHGWLSVFFTLIDASGWFYYIIVHLVAAPFSFLLYCITERVEYGVAVVFSFVGHRVFSLVINCGV